MTNIIRRKYRASRRIGQNLWGRAKDPVETKNYRPGQHGANGRRVTSDYGRQLEAKQTLKRHYGRLSEKQFRRVFKEANRQRGDTSANLIGLLESRLDAVVYRAKFAPTIFAARQLVSHKHILVNGSRVNIASYQVNPGDVVELKEKSREIPMVIEGKQSAERDVAAYVELDSTGFKATFVKRPLLEDVPYAVTMSPHLVVEFYSR